MQILWQYATKYGIHPAIIVGRLQHKKLIPFTANADVFEKIDLFG